MEILGIGPSELVFVVIIALIVLGPKDMQKAGRTIGQWLNKLVKSEGWKVFQQTSRELRNLPTNLMRGANMDLKEAEDDIRRAIDPRSKPLASSPSPSLPPSEEVDNSTQGEPPTVNTPAVAPGGGSNAEDDAKGAMNQHD
jgi:sec-independent protein translocase protein TatB